MDSGTFSSTGQSGCSCNLIRTTGHLERPLIEPIRMIRLTRSPHTYILHRYSRIALARIPDDASQWLRILWDRFAPAFPFTCMRHILVAIVPHECKKVECRRELETSSGSAHVIRRWSSASAFIHRTSKSCLNAYSLSEFSGNNIIIMMMHYVNLRNRISL